MKKFNLIILTSLLCFCVSSAAAQNKAAKSKGEPKTVTDFYLLLPAKFLPILAAHQNRRALIDVEDLKNGYLRLGNNEWEGWGEVAIFKKKSGGYLVAVTQYNCGPVCEGEAVFLNYNKGKWSRADDVLPRFTVGELYEVFQKKNKREPEDEETVIYELPRKGRDITVKMGDTAVYYLSWNGATFDGGPAD